MLQLQVIVHCPDCDEVRVRPHDVTLRNCIDDDSWSYRFTCPTCGGLTVAFTDTPSVIEAFAAGAGLERWRLPAELLETHAGPPLTLADLFAFRRLLLAPDWFDALDRDGA